MQPVEYIVVTLNLVAGLSFAVPLSRLFSRLNKEPPRFFRYFAIFIGIYFLECVAIVFDDAGTSFKHRNGICMGHLFRFVALGPHIATQSP